MSRISKVLGFLTLNDFSLMFVMGGAIGVNVITFNIVLGMKRPILGNVIQNPHGEVDSKLVVGAALFGMGWGIAGICPGPALVNVFLVKHMVLCWIGPFIAGTLLAQVKDLF